MAINLLGNVNQNNIDITNTLANGSISAAKQSASEASLKLLSSINDMMPGQIIEGKLLETDGNAAKLLLNNNLILNTQIQSDANLNIGQTFSFEIQSNNGKLLALRPLHTNVSNESTAVKALEAASVKVSEETIKMVDSLMKEGMPINKEMLNNINRDLNAYPNSDVESIVLLNKLNMPVNQENIDQMTMYNNNNRWMMESVDNMASDLSKVLIDNLGQKGFDSESFLNSLKDMFSKIGDSSDDLSLSKAMELFDKLKNLSAEKLSRPNIMNHIKRDLTTIFSDKLLLKPEDVADKENIKQYYSKTFEFVRELEQLLNGNLKGDNVNDLQKSLSQIRDNMNFMNDINEMFNYVQLPLKMADSQANGDLYVYRRNNGKQFTGEEESLTALLHLSMETLGNMDIFLKLEQEKLSTKFCLEKEEMIDFIESHIDELNVRLIKKGYNIDTSVGKLEGKESNVIDLINGKKEEVMILSNQTFDARA